MRHIHIRTMQENMIFEDGDAKVEVNLKDETVWLTQEHIIQLSGRDQSVISRHIKNIFKEEELEKNCNMQKMHIAKSDKPITLYSLDVIISVGYRVKSKEGTKFRIWVKNFKRLYVKRICS